MDSFPILSTGAVLQYPASKSLRFSTQIVRFIDGSEQRFSDYPKVLRRWTVALDRLSETEMNKFREFFRIRNGAAGQFSFTDPWDGALYPNCSLENDQMAETLVEEGRGKTTLIIRENRS